MHVIDRSFALPASAAACFGYIDTPENIPEFVFGAKEFRYLDTAAKRSGSRFELRLKLGPIAMVLEGRITEYSTDRLIAMSLDKGLITGTVVWELTPVDAEQCTASIRVEYRVARGITGRALSKIIDSILEPAIGHTESQLRDNLIGRQHAAPDPMATNSPSPPAPPAPAP